MAGLFGQAVTALQGFFTRGFWFGAFLPAAIFAALNLLLARFAFDWATGLTQEVIADKWIWSAPVFAGLIILAYATAPLVPLCRAVLDGRRLPDFLFEMLRAQPLAEQRKAFADLNAADNYLRQTRVVMNTAATQLPLQRTAGIALGTAMLQNEVDAATDMVRRLQRSLDRGKVPAVTTLRDAVTAVTNALRDNSVDLAPALNDVEFGMLDTLSKAMTNGTTHYNRQLERCRKLPRDVQPTAIGNARNLSEFYSQSVYNVEFAFLWPRVQMVIPENDPAIKRIDAARSLVDFAVLSLVLVVVLLATWLPTLAMHGASTWPFLLLGVVGPLLVRFFYQLVVESQISLGEVAQGVVDRFRFDLLKTLHIKPPATLSAEREIWSTLSRIAGGEAPDTDLVWTNPG